MGPPGAVPRSSRRRYPRAGDRGSAVSRDGGPRAESSGSRERSGPLTGTDRTRRRRPPTTTGTVGGMSVRPDIDPDRFTVHTASPRGFAQAYVRENGGGVPLVCVHGWPESKRIFWKVIEPLAAAGFEVIAPTCAASRQRRRADGFHDVAAHAADLYALVHDPPGPRLGRAPRWRPRWPGHPAPGAGAPPSGSTAWCCSTVRWPSTRSGWPGSSAPRGPRESSGLLRAPGARPRRVGVRAGDRVGPPPLHRHLLHQPLLGAPRRVHRGALLTGSVRRHRRGRLPHRTLR